MKYWGEQLNNLDERILEGHYAKKQILCKDPLISWSHRTRFKQGLQLAREFGGKRILDYGCGDGTFLAMLMAQPTAPASAVGCEIKAGIVEDCRLQLGHVRGLTFVLADELDAPQHNGAYDAVVCMEVLEHVIDVVPLLDRFSRLLTGCGTLVTSVPVETGVPLLVKQVVRRIAGWRRLGDYPGTSSYNLNELWRGLFASRREHIVRPIFRDASGASFHDHKGFNWMVLREALKRRFHLERVLGSPVPSMPPHLASQVWFVLKNKL